MDHECVWQLIAAAVTGDNDRWTYTKPAQRTGNGLLVFLSLYGHYLLGVNNVENMAAAAERQLHLPVTLEKGGNGYLRSLLVFK
jgi:hypothetical protein